MIRLITWIFVAGIAWALGLAIQMLSAAEAQTAEDLPRLEVIVEQVEAGPVEREMIIVTLQSSFLDRVALHDVEELQLGNFSWVQLGRDTWKRSSHRQNLTEFQRRLAIFPQRPGVLTIGPFAQNVTLIGTDGRRRAVRLTTDPVDITVAAQPKTATEATAWWLPARSLVVEDRWDPAPDMIPIGQTTRRTVTIVAEGTTAEQLPPGFDLSGPDFIAFAGPTERSTTATPDGPVARAVYRWDIRPRSPGHLMLDAVPLPWFDTTTRRMRRAELPAMRIAFAIPGMDLPPQASGNGVLRWPLYAAGFAAFLLAAGILLAGSDGRRTPLPVRLRRWHEDRRALRPIRFAARRGDAAAARSAAHGLARASDRLRRALEDEKVRHELSQLDRLLFSPGRCGQADPAVLARLLDRALKRRAGSNAH